MKKLCSLNQFKFQACLNHGFPIFFKKSIIVFKKLLTNNYYSNSELVTVLENIYKFLRPTNAYFF